MKLKDIMNEGDFDDLGLKGYGSELDQDDDGGKGFKGDPMFDQLGKILDSQSNPNPITTVQTDDGETVKVTPQQARVLRQLLTAEGMKPNIKMQFTRDLQQSATLHDFVDQKDYHKMGQIFMMKYM
tara:strand:+ start:2170 stop:2547 length:378 start_codon:yes stop_codon:yes gene_type:complete